MKPLIEGCMVQVAVELWGNLEDERICTEQGAINKLGRRNGRGKKRKKGRDRLREREQHARRPLRGGRSRRPRVGTFERVVGGIRRRKSEKQ